MISLNGFRYKVYNNKVVCYYDATNQFSGEIVKVGNLDVVKVPNILASPISYDFQDSLKSLKDN